jgi:cell division septum initiation protein DivIVA
VDSWDEVNRQQAALALFHPSRSGAAGIQRELPLEPALASLAHGISAAFEAISTNTEDLQQQIEQWQQQQQQQQRSASQAAATAAAQRGAAGSPWQGGLFGSPAAAAFKRSGGFGGFRSPAAGWGAGSGRVVSSAAGATPPRAAASPAAGAGAGGAISAGVGHPSNQVEVLYKVVRAQQETEANLRARIAALRQQMEALCVIRTDADHLGGQALGRWGDALLSADEDGGSSDDDGYGSEGTTDSEYEHEPKPAPLLHTPAHSGLRSGSRLSAGTPGSAAAASRRTPHGSAGTPASSLWSGGRAGFSTPAISGRAPGTQLHFVTPGASAAYSGGRGAPAAASGLSGGSTGTRRQAMSGSSSKTSSAAWHRLAVELSNSTGQQRPGASSSQGKVRTTYATPLRSGSAGVRQAPPRRSSPLHIPAAAAAAAPRAASPVPAQAFQGFSSAGMAAAPPGGGAGSSSGSAFTTPAAKSQLPGKLSFTPAAAAEKEGASPALSPLQTPAAAGSSQAKPFMQANPLFGVSPGPGAASPMAAVPAPKLKLGGGTTAPAAPRPPAAAKAAVPKAGQPPEPPAALLQAAATVCVRVCVCVVWFHAAMRSRGM